MATATEVRERPILFSGPMVRAIRDGLKTKTRRVVKPQPPVDEDGECNWTPIGLDYYEPTVVGPDGEERPGKEIFGAYDEEWGVACPYGGPGQRLWVRETYWEYPGIISDRMLRDGADTWPEVIYDADGDRDWCIEHGWVRKPSIFLRRQHSRTTLGITGVRVERVQEISESDAVAEGCLETRWDSYGRTMLNTAKCNFRELWDTINAKRGYGWKENPWTWVIEFRKESP